MANGPTLTTFHEWDVAGVKKGAAAIDAEYKKLIRTEQLVGRQQALNDAAMGKRQKAMQKNAKETGKIFENIGWSIRDLIEGRTGYAFVRMTKALGGVAVAGYAVYRAFKAMNDEIKRTNQQNEALQTSWAKASYAAGFTTSAEGGSSIRTKRAGLNTEIGAQRALEMGILEKNQQMDEIPLVGRFRRGWEMMRKDIGDSALGQSVGLGPIKTRDEITHESQQRQNELQKNLKANIAMGRESEQNQYSLARAGTLSGDPLTLKRKELEIQQKIELSKAAEEQATADELQIIKSKYLLLNANVDKLENARKRSFELTKKEAMLGGSSGSAISKTLGAATMQKNEAEWQLENGRLNPQERHAAQMQFIAADSTIRGTLASRYLDPETGKKRRNGVIQKQFRNERNAARRMAAFQRRVDRGEFDPETGRKTGTGISGGGGLPAGALNKIEREGMDTMLPRGVFGKQARKDMIGALDISTKASGMLLEKLISIVAKRLPSEVAGD